jgi:folate-binding protein YgfZ
MQETIQALSGVAKLTHLGVIRVTGDDAAKFVHGQLTQDFALLGTDQARLAAFCSAKGRMQASFIGFKQNNGDLLLICNHDVLSATLKRLSMFVMRAKAKLSDASAEFSLFGVASGSSGPDEMPENAGTSAWKVRHEGNSTVVSLYPAQGVARELWVVPGGDAAPAGEPLSGAMWDWSEVASGVATVSQAVAEAFVPQMLNYESVGGVSFKKGCYPGQEVVARSQFRGTLKRRAYRVHTHVSLQPGQEIFAAAADSQPVGLVVQAAPAPQGGFDAIAVLQVEAANTGALRLDGDAGAPLELLPLPYQLLEDI